MSKTIQKCHICNKHEIKFKDYRYIESFGFQGKILSCEWCFNLNANTIKKIRNNGLDPKIFFIDTPINYKIISLTPKHYAGRCYGFTIDTDNGMFHIDSHTLFNALSGVELKDLKPQDSRAREKMELVVNA